MLDLTKVFPVDFDDFVAGAQNVVGGSPWLDFGHEDPGIVRAERIAERTDAA